MTNYRLPNKEVVIILKEAVAAMEIKNFNFFEIRAFQNAIAILDNLTNSIYDIWENKRLDEIPGLGKSLMSYLNELFTTGAVKKFEMLKKGLPDGMFALLGLRGIGAKKAFKLAHAFKLVKRDTAIDQLKKHALAHEIQVLEGFGEKSENDILTALEAQKLTKNEKPRTLLYKAEEIVARIIDYMKQFPEVLRIEAAGSFRRRNGTVGDLDFIVATNEPQKVIEAFTKFPEVDEILAKGEHKAMVVLKNEMQADIRVSTPQAYGALIQYNTDSKQHNIVIRTYALEKGLSLSEYGIKKGDKIFEFADEEGFYKYLGLDYIPPEIRHGSNEVELAAKHKLPKLIELRDTKGDLQSHTTDSDGVNSLEEMVEMAISLGYKYYGVSDHAPSVQSRGYDEVKKIILATRKKIDALNKRQNKIKVLFGYEVNILADATLGLPDDLLEMLDFAIDAIHTSFDQGREQITKRLVAAIKNPYINFIGHPSGRLINERDPIDPDWHKVFTEALDNNKILEINAQPNRLDLSDDLAHEAIGRGIKLIINTDAHENTQMGLMRYGIENARRGSVEAKDVVNTYNFAELVKSLGVRHQ